MAGDWLKVEVCTGDKPEVWTIAEMLSIDPDAVVGKLIRIWAWFDQQTLDGNAGGNASSVTSGNAVSVSVSATMALLDRKVGVTGFCQAMVSVGWMADSGGTLTLPNFDRHNGKTAKNRALTAKRVFEHKKKSNAGSVTSSNAKVTVGALPREDNREDTNTNAERVAGWWDDQAFSRTWAQWRNHLFALGKPLTAYSEDIQLNSLTSIAGTVAERIAIVEHTIERGARNLIIDGGHRKDRLQPRVSRVATQEDLDNYDPNGNYD